MGFEVPIRHILSPTLSIDMVQRVLQWEGQKRCFGRKRQGPHGREMLLKWNFNGIYFGEEKMKTKEDKRMVKLAFFQNCHFWTRPLYPLESPSKKLRIHFLVHGGSSWSTFGLHLVRAHRLCQLIFSKNRIMKSDHEKKPPSMVRLHGPSCKPTLGLLWISALVGHEFQSRTRQRLVWRISWKMN
jgi:hypothetical protein